MKPGADVILDPVFTSHFAKNIASLRAEGRWVIYGFLSGHAFPQVPAGQLLVKRANLLFTTLRGRDDAYKAKLTQAFVGAKVLEKVLAGQFNPMIYKVLPLAEASEAHRILESNENTGKVVLLTPN